VGFQNRGSRGGIHEKKKEGSKGGPSMYTGRRMKRPSERRCRRSNPTGVFTPSIQEKDTAKRHETKEKGLQQTLCLEGGAICKTNGGLKAFNREPNASRRNKARTTPTQRKKTRKQEMLIRRRRATRCNSNLRSSGKPSHNLSRKQEEGPG